MKIGYIMQAGVPDLRTTPRSGPANHVFQVIEELRALGHDVRLLADMDGRTWRSDDLTNFAPVTPCQSELTLRRLFERAIRRVQSELHVPYIGLFDSSRFVGACHRELAGFDLLYERMGWMGYAGALASRLSGKPLVLEVNGDHLSELRMLGIEPRGIQRSVSTALTGWGARQADHVIATGAGWARQFEDRWRVPSRKISVVENGSEVVDLLDRRNLRAFEADIDPTNPVSVVYVGGLDPWQGLSHVIHAVKAVQEGGCAVQLTLIGTGPEKKALARLVEAVGLNGRVNMTGHLPLPEMAKHLSRADIGVSAYCGREEFSGLKLLDYKAAGLAIVASGEEGEPTVLRDGETGLIVPPCDEAAFTGALVRLASDSELRRRLGHRARIEAESSHTWRRTATALSDILEQVTFPRRSKELAESYRVS